MIFQPWKLRGLWPLWLLPERRPCSAPLPAERQRPKGGLDAEEEKGDSELRVVPQSFCELSQKNSESFVKTCLVTSRQVVGFVQIHCLTLPSPEVGMTMVKKTHPHGLKDLKDPIGKRRNQPKPVFFLTPHPNVPDLSISKSSRISFDYPEATCRSGAKVGIWSCMEHRFHQTSETRLNLSLRTFKSIEVVVQTRWNGKVWNCSFPCFHFDRFGNFLGVDVLFQLEWLDSPCIWGSIHAGWRAPSAHLPGDGWREWGRRDGFGPAAFAKKGFLFLSLQRKGALQLLSYRRMPSWKAVVG